MSKLLARIGAFLKRHEAADVERDYEKMQEEQSHPPDVRGQGGSSGRTIPGLNQEPMSKQESTDLQRESDL
jgi:hypothetical protein